MLHFHRMVAQEYGKIPDREKLRELRSAEEEVGGSAGRGAQGPQKWGRVTSASDGVLMCPPL